MEKIMNELDWSDSYYLYGINIMRHFSLWSSKFDRNKQVNLDFVSLLLIKIFKRTLRVN